MQRINGYFCTDGLLDGRGFYLVEIRDGRIFADDLRLGDEKGELYLRQYGNDAPILTNGVWQFWPDESDLARLNLTPTQTKE